MPAASSAKIAELRAQVGALRRAVEQLNLRVGVLEREGFVVVLEAETSGPSALPASSDLGTSSTASPPAGD